MHACQMCLEKREKRGSRVVAKYILYIHIYIYICVRTHTHTHTYIHAYSRRLGRAAQKYRTASTSCSNCRRGRQATKVLDHSVHFPGTTCRAPAPARAGHATPSRLSRPRTPAWARSSRTFVSIYLSIYLSLYLYIMYVCLI